MRVPRIYLPVLLERGECITLDSNATNHVSRVLRLKQGTNIRLFDGEGREFHATLGRVERNCVEATIEAAISETSESPLRITLAQGISRGERMDLVVQKSVELGVDTIVPLLTERTNVQLKRDRQQKKLGHWRGITISACEQCGRNQLPALEPITTFDQLLETPFSGTRLLLDPKAEVGLNDIKPEGSAIQLLIGPEGGLSSSEIERARAHGFLGVRMGPRVLRTETAAIAALTALQLLWGDLGG